MKALSPVVFRGEPDGQLREEGNWLRPWFFAESREHAKAYARKTEPLACVIQGRRVLDLTEPDPLNPDHRQLARLMHERFEEWVCRYSGEPSDFWMRLEAGDLYDYDGTGSGERWHNMFRIALEEMGFDAVRAIDVTDGGEGEDRLRVVWVTQNRENIRMASPGETLARMIEQRLDWKEISRYIDREMPSLEERITRLRIEDPDYALSAAAESIGIFEVAEHLRVWRALPTEGEIRPGDWVALDRSYAEMHVRGDSDRVKSLNQVNKEDIFWAGTDKNEFFYLPAAWRIRASSTEEYLRQLDPTRIRLLCDGELSSITRHREKLNRLTDALLSKDDLCDILHGPEHWERVRENGITVSRSMGKDPLIPYIFGWVHDSQRENEHVDPLHGERAAQFVHEHRNALFDFLDDDQVQRLSNACLLHSEGTVEGNADEMACWDADRLDLWRVGIEPMPELLCTNYAKRPAVITSARDLDRFHSHAQGYSGRESAHRRERCF